MVITRMPEDRSKAFKHIQPPSNTFTAICTCMCTPVGRTERYNNNTTIQTSTHNTQIHAHENHGCSPSCPPGRRTPSARGPGEPQRWALRAQP
eukprot:3974938-Heterocapsa_arctica.AAC.1